MSLTLESRITQILNKVYQLAGSGAYIYTAQALLSINIPAGTAAGTPLPVSMSITLGQNNLSGSALTIPATQAWIVADIYTSASPYIDGAIQIYKNGVKLLETTPNLSALAVTNPARIPIPIAVKYAPQETLSMNFVPAAANTGSTTVSESAYAVVIVIDFSYSQLPPASISSMISTL